jgi:uncharacterized protein YtpQ (UPF0354 family)
MRSIFYAFIVVFGLITEVHAEAPSPGAFTSQFARALQAAMPSAKVSVIRDLQLDVQRADGTSALVSLANNYRDYSTEPKWFDDVVNAYAAALAKPPSQGAKLDQSRIVPVVKDRAWLAELRARFRQQSASEQPVFDDLNKELVVVYAEDAPNTTRYLSSSEELGVERSKLRALAIENVMRLMPKIESRQLSEGAFMVTSHGDYGASLVLVDSIWSGDQFKVNGDIVVAVPAKDVILVTGSRDRKNLKTMRQFANKLANGNYGLIDTLFVYRKGRFVKFGRD